MNENSSNSCLLSRTIKIRNGPWTIGLDSGLLDNNSKCTNNKYGLTSSSLSQFLYTCRQTTLRAKNGTFGITVGNETSGALPATGVSGNTGTLLTFWEGGNKKKIKLGA